ncbi:hypothetical protein PR048_031904 [Dryococelus australis]|uniref:Transposase n=1 Tax=Dryococelus australis TaxID=614101 RepID=A0ABQ9G6L4_9NEOP|nr:hypothetical protein PR048_031904 [Dryococelus australis]
MNWSSTRVETIFLSIKETAAEITDKIFLRLSEQIGVPLKIKDIDRSHRVGRKHNGAQRPIIAKFFCFIKRCEVFRKKKNLKNIGVTIREDITAAHLQVLQEYICRFRVKKMWTVDGAITNVRSVLLT